MLIDIEISEDKNMIKNEAEKILIYKHLTVEIKRMRDVKAKVIPIIINKGNWDHLKIIHKIRQKHTGKARHQGTTENSHFWHCVHNSESDNVKVQNIFHNK